MIMMMQQINKNYNYFCHFWQKYIFWYAAEF